jgi:hypothetical protein
MRGGLPAGLIGSRMQSPVGASLLAMVANDNAWQLIHRQATAYFSQSALAICNPCNPWYAARSG